MASSLLDDKSIQPDDAQLQTVLGKSFELWVDINEHLEETYGAVTPEWKFYSQKSGWIRKTLLKKRNLFFFLPVENYFKITFVFGDKAVAAVEQSDLPQGIADELKNARKYMEGRGIQIVVKSADDVKNVKKLIDIKISN